MKTDKKYLIKINTELLSVNKEEIFSLEEAFKNKEAVEAKLKEKILKLKSLPYLRDPEKVKLKLKDLEAQLNGLKIEELVYH
jgi:hypothetical protein